MRFPKNSKIIALWETAINRPEWSANVHSRVCSKHFSDDCFYLSKGNKRNLTDDAVPNQNLPSPAPPPDTATLKDSWHLPDPTDTPKEADLRKRLRSETILSRRRYNAVKRSNAKIRKQQQKISSLKKVLRDILKTRPKDVLDDYDYHIDYDDGNDQDDVPFNDLDLLKDVDDPQIKVEGLGQSN